MAKHELHQFDLIPAVAKRIVAEADLSAGSAVFEIGPGTGSLTEPMLDAGAQIYAVEIDAQRAGDLRQRFADAISHGALQVLVGDAHTMMPLFNDVWRIIANPPFQHTASLLRKCLLEDLPSGSPQRIDLVLQQDTAEKWVGRRGEETRSSILAQLWGEASISAHLKRSDVKPASHVDLCVFSLRRREDALSPADLRCVDSLLNIAFAGPHSVRNALRKVTTPAILKRQSKEHAWQADAHPRSLSAIAWHSLAMFLRSLNKI